MWSSPRQTTESSVVVDLGAVFVGDRSLKEFVEELKKEDESAALSKKEGETMEVTREEPELDEATQY